MANIGALTQAPKHSTSDNVNILSSVVWPALIPTCRERCELCTTVCRLFCSSAVRVLHYIYNINVTLTCH